MKRALSEWAEGRALYDRQHHEPVLIRFSLETVAVDRPIHPIAHMPEMFLHARYLPFEMADRLAGNEIRLKRNTKLHEWAVAVNHVAESGYQRIALLGCATG